MLRRVDSDASDAESGVEVSGAGVTPAAIVTHIQPLKFTAHAIGIVLHGSERVRALFQAGLRWLSRDLDPQDPKRLGGCTWRGAVGRQFLAILHDRFIESREKEDDAQRYKLTLAFWSLE